MNTIEAVKKRIQELLDEKGWSENHLFIESAVPQRTINSIMNNESKNPGVVTIKKLCDAFGISLGQFFSTDYFDDLEQEIK